MLGILRVWIQTSLTPPKRKKFYYYLDFSCKLFNYIFCKCYWNRRRMLWKTTTLKTKTSVSQLVPGYTVNLKTFMEIMKKWQTREIKCYWFISQHESLNVALKLSWREILNPGGKLVKKYCNQKKNASSKLLKQPKSPPKYRWHDPAYNKIKWNRPQRAETPLQTCLHLCCTPNLSSWFSKTRPQTDTHLNSFPWCHAGFLYINMCASGSPLHPPSSAKSILIPAVIHWPRITPLVVTVFIIMIPYLIKYTL